MSVEDLKQAELFVFLAMVFLIGMFVVSARRGDVPLAPETDQPPIIMLSEENDEYRFDLGSAEIPDVFREALEEEIVPLLDELSRRYRCDTLEIVGHTDGVRMCKALSTLDEELVGALHSDYTRELVAGSNLDLGMMRAIAIVKILRESQNVGWLGNVKYILPYSAGQLIEVDRSLVREVNDMSDDRSRRRIEIRLLRSNSLNIEDAGLSQFAANGRR
jgi:flagellar motor protein MotB